MATVIVNFSTKVDVVPADVDPGSFFVDIGGDKQEVVSGPVTFTDVRPGDYVATVARYAKDGVTIIGDKATQAFNVPVPTQNVDVPDVVTVSLA